MNVSMRGFFIAYKLPEPIDYGAKVKLSVITTDDFQKYAKRELDKMQN